MVGRSEPLCPEGAELSQVSPRMSVLGVPVSVIDLAGVTSMIVGWAGAHQARTVFVRDVHGVMRSVDDPSLMDLHQHADLVIPDGTPLVWLGRLRGYGPAIGRTSGADVVDAVCKSTAGTDIRHFFYGGKPGVALEMARRLQEKYPGLKVAGTYTPGFGPPSPEEKAAERAALRDARPHIVWVGLSTPKQEFWMMENVHDVGAVLLGVGAAFDFHTGAVKRAPPWMRDNGLEWLHRLASEPRRLWHRYLVLAPRFVFSIVADAITHRSRP
jgi:N-acetylglucosaminyldiphosphoundecaprenol N-acetyl-beta-D-mannosaminyltransferase